MPRDGFPDFIIIGAMKCATSSLHVMLNKHPEVSTSRIKETDFFISTRAESWYRDQFDPTRRLWGEASPNYAMRHRYAGVPDRIAARIPEVLVIYLVRDPIDRIASHWVHRVASGLETRPFGVAIRDGSSYADTSRYAYQLRPYVARFGRDRILVLDQAELSSEPAVTWSRLLAFIGASPDIEVPIRRLHESSVKRRPSRLDTWLGNRQSRRSRWLHTLPGPLTTRADIDRPIPSPDDLAVLREQLAEDAAEFRALSGMAFSGWSV